MIFCKVYNKKCKSCNKKRLPPSNLLTGAVGWLVGVHRHVKHLLGHPRTHIRYQGSAQLLILLGFLLLLLFLLRALLLLVLDFLLVNNFFFFTLSLGDVALLLKYINVLKNMEKGKI